MRRKPAVSTLAKDSKSLKEEGGKSGASRKPRERRERVGPDASMLDTGGFESMKQVALLKLWVFKFSLFTLNEACTITE